MMKGTTLLTTIIACSLAVHALNDGTSNPIKDSEPKQGNHVHRKTLTFCDLLPTICNLPVPSTPTTSTPSSLGTSNPSHSPVVADSESPTSTTTTSSSQTPSSKPSSKPTTSPTQSPSGFPISNPSLMPSSITTTQPTTESTPNPTKEPTTNPSLNPTSTSSSAPSNNPFNSPSSGPTSNTSEPPTASTPSSEQSPNLIVIMTDQHNYRTIGCYRDYLVSKNQTKQAFVWGPDIKVETPNIDSIANEGAMFTNFQSAAPLCTPNRASFFSGLYPPATGADRNSKAMNEDVVTFAQLLREKKNYNTGYFGKWHLDGQPKPGWRENLNRPDFGFNHMKYMFNKGHWKFFEDLANGKVKEYDYRTGNNKFRKKREEHFATDFLVDRGIEFIENNRQQGNPFFAFLSLPDPHPPKEVRPPYNTMYNNFDFELPYTARTATLRSPASPLWNRFDHMNVPLDGAESYLDEYQSEAFYQLQLRQYFGMVKCIDDNVGKILQYLNDTGLDDDTIVIFTSDHGDMLSEHGKFNKNRPYRGSAGVPFIVRYPPKVVPGKIVETAYTAVDFAPTILKMLGAEDPTISFHGIDFSDELLNGEVLTSKDTVRFVFDCSNNRNWVAAFMNNYRLIISKADVPWLMDLDEDPFEIENFYTTDTPEISYAREQLQTALFDAMSEYDMPLYNVKSPIYWTQPTCIDSRDRLPTQAVAGLCTDLGVSIPILDRCSKQKFQIHCPYTCGTCCADSPGKILSNGNLFNCANLSNRCGNFKVGSIFCPLSCEKCNA